MKQYDGEVTTNWKRFYCDRLSIIESSLYTDTESYVMNKIGELEYDSVSACRVFKKIQMKMNSVVSNLEKVNKNKRNCARFTTLFEKVKGQQYQVEKLFLNHVSILSIEFINCDNILVFEKEL
jgi:hypothetical protein